MRFQNVAPSVPRHDRIGHTARISRYRMPTGRATESNVVDGNRLAAERQPCGQCRRDGEVGDQHAGNQHDDVVEVVRGFLARERLELVVAVEGLPAHQQADARRRQRADDHAEEQPERDRVGLEGVDGLDDAGPGDERAEDDEREAESSEHDRPALEAVPAPVDGEGVKQADAGQPRKQAGVLDRVPRPVAAPAEHDVRPDGAQTDADAEKQPREHRDAVDDLDPLLGAVVDDQGRDGEGERES